MTKGHQPVSSDCIKSAFSRNIPIENVGAVIDRPVIRRNKSEEYAVNIGYLSCFASIKICNVSGAH